LAAVLPAVERRCVLRARAAIGAVVRDCLRRSGADPASVWALRLAGEARAELAALRDTARRRAADDELLGRLHDGQYGAAAEAFDAKLADLVSRYRGAATPDPARASLLEWFAWSLARHARRHASGAERPESRAGGVAAP
jgi:hypothetical protein